MRTILVSGGMGNQMFQYALYLSMKEKGMEVNAVTSLCDNNFLEPYGIMTKQLPKGQYPAFYLDDSLMVHKLYKALMKRFPISGNFYTEKHNSVYEPKVFSVKDGVFIDGYWQSYKYFEDCFDTVKQVFSYKGEWSESNTKYREKMDKTNSVCVHIRRGDYLKYPKYQGICTEEYYAEAINLIKKKVESPFFYVFSNDLEWSKRLFTDETVVYVEGNCGLSSYMDMVLMTYCKHHIIANSSFSWWGTVLSSKEGITISPKTWLNNEPTPDIWMDNWLKL